MKLRLSPHVLPQLRLGLHNLKPQNLTPGADRLHYATAMVQLLRSLMARGRFEDAKRLRDELPFGPHLVLWNDEAEGANKLEELPELANAISFDPDALGVLLRDGRIRDDGAMAYLPSGTTTPELTALLRALHRGIERAELLAMAAELDIGFDEELLDDLIARGAIEPGEVLAPKAPVAPAIEWLGHAYVRAISPSATVWFDPFTAPRVAWTDEERATMFAGDVPDSFLLANYAPEAHQVTQDELAIPHAIFVTHSDTDHADLGVISLVPPEVPIYVPASDPDQPWQVDMVAVIRNVLGPDRNVIVLRHGESVQLGDIRVTAFPFVGEFPPALPHHWNCYLVELPDQVWALCADSAVTEVQVDWLRERLSADTRPFGIMVNAIVHQRTMAGYRDAVDEPTSFTRLYSWYLPPVRLFDPTPMCGLPVDLLARLVKEARLTYVYPYAHGNLPWYRMTATALHHSHVGSHTLSAFHTMERVAIEAGARVLRLQHGIPHVANASSPFPRR
ncbi:MAG: MBL fold metallo-hydrolase [Myxococcales bacterium]|nr:MBL fold metallo-hydrolase [Myxococcales bacterium]